MEARILLDISEKFEKALRRLAYAIAAGAAIAKEGTAQSQDVPAGCKRPEPRGTRRLCTYTSEEAPMADAPKADEAPTADASKADEAPTSDAPKTSDASKADDAPKKRKAKKQAPAVEISTSAAIAEGEKEGDGIEKDMAEAETAEGAETAPTPESAREAAAEPEDKPEAQENEDELGKGAVGEVISELTGRLINRMNEEARDKATINRNLRAKCEELQLKFPTVPALIQAIGYGNAYKACIGEG